MSKNNDAYWKANLRLMRNLLIVWFVVSFGFGIILVDVLNNIQIGGYKLGFWFAQQGAIYVFVVLIFVYSKKWQNLTTNTALKKKAKNKGTTPWTYKH